MNYHLRAPITLFMVILILILFQIEIELALLWDRCYKYMLVNN